VAGSSNADGVTITTGAGADTITGSDGADTITAAAGANTMTGGAGFDTFVVVATNATASDADRITDFNNNAGEIIQVGAGGTAAASVQDQTAFDASAAANVAAAADLAAAATVGHTAAQYDVYLFTFGTSTYAFSDVDATTVGSYDTSGDVIVEITGTTVTDLTTANFDLA
jgi:Ca2+-binding RTX toxin-like protein